MRAFPDSTVFSRAEARACGWTDAAIGRALRSGRVHAVRHGFLTAVGQPSLTVAAVAAVRACPGAVISHRSAAVMWEIPLLGAQPTVPELTVRPDGIRSLAGVHVHHARLRAIDIRVIDGTAVTSPARTAVDLARHLRFGAAVAAADDVLHRELATLDDIHDVMRSCWNWPGMGRAQRALRDVDGRAESPLESISRLVIVRLRLPRPEPQCRIFDENGLFIGRCDFYWDEFGVAGEADGRGKYDARAVLWREKERQEGLEDVGVVVARWGWTDATARHRRLKLRLENAFERGRLRDRSGFPRKWSVRRS